jgi:hypothetical protein
MCDDAGSTRASCSPFATGVEHENVFAHRLSETVERDL